MSVCGFVFIPDSDSTRLRRSFGGSYTRWGPMREIVRWGGLSSVVLTWWVMEGRKRREPL